MSLSPRTQLARAMIQSVIEARNQQMRAAEARFLGDLRRARDRFRVEMAGIDAEMRARIADILAGDGQDDQEQEEQG